MNMNEYTKPLSEEYAFKTKMFNYLIKIFESNALITTIKIGWCEIGSNFQLLPITANYYQLLSIKIDSTTLFYQSRVKMSNHPNLIETK